MPIKVDATSKLAKALRLHPNVLDYIVGLNPHDFKRLYNPVMRRLMPPRITLARIAKMTSTPIMEMLVRIHEIAECSLSETERKELARGLSAVESENLPANPENAPQWIKHDVAVIVDLLENDARLDADPLPPIMKSLRKLAAEEIMVVKHMWEPQPLYDIWSKQGVEYYAEQKSPDEWWIYLRWKE